jgi:NAD(P)-dependent dehydrogenase (short-subunit alcohol dehydrogenase family)
MEIVVATGDDFDRIFNFNVRGLFLCYKYAARQMVELGRGGRSISASSAYGKKGPSASSLMIDSLDAFGMLTLCNAKALPTYQYTVRVNLALGVSPRGSRSGGEMSC